MIANARVVTHNDGTFQGFVTINPKKHYHFLKYVMTKRASFFEALFDAIAYRKKLLTEGDPFKRW